MNITEEIPSSWIDILEISEDSDNSDFCEHYHNSNQVSVYAIANIQKAELNDLENASSQMPSNRNFSIDRFLSINKYFEVVEYDRLFSLLSSSPLSIEDFKRYKSGLDLNIQVPDRTLSIIFLVKAFTQNMIPLSLGKISKEKIFLGNFF